MIDRANAIDNLSLDELGRAVLSDEIIKLIEDNDKLLSAGGTNWRCNGTANGACSNAQCNESMNASCSNQSTCSGSANMYACQSPEAGIPVNSSCV